MNDEVVTLVIPMRTFIQTEVSEEYKALYQEILGPYRDMSPDIRRLIEQEYPQLRELAERERQNKAKVSIKPKPVVKLKRKDK